ncbi:MAG: hypothetical protein ACO3FE_11785, partial [Planctomycetaceae bacterium]
DRPGPARFGKIDQRLRDRAEQRNSVPVPAMVVQFANGWQFPVYSLRGDQSLIGTIPPAEIRVAAVWFLA